MIDIQLLRMMRTKTDFNKIVGAVDMSALETRTRKVIAAIKKYYVTYPKHGKIDFTTVLTECRTIWCIQRG